MKILVSNNNLILFLQSPCSIYLLWTSDSFCCQDCVYCLIVYLKHFTGESSVLERSLNPGLDSVGVRVPDCDFIRVIAHGWGTAPALTSANLSGQPSSVCIKDFENLREHCAFVYDGGSLPSAHAGSTVVDLTTPHKYKILRPGRYLS